MNALMNNPYTEGWRAVGRSIPTPKAILSISANWYVPGTGGDDLHRTADHSRLVAFSKSHIGFFILSRRSSVGAAGSEAARAVQRASSSLTGGFVFVVALHAGRN
jgi:hypothetical protein